MRPTFIRELLSAAERDERVWLLTGDLGYTVLEPFAERFPDRYVNTGIAEQNMIGVAAGLAMAGKKVFVYSIANFPTFRCLEQIRNDLCYHDADVTVVSVGAGFSYGTQGYTHHGLEDLAVMRALPGMAVVAPGDVHEAAAAISALLVRKGPAYLRLGKAGAPLSDAPAPTPLGRMHRLLEGKDALLIGTGSMAEVALAAARQAQRDGLSVGAWSSPWVKPFDADAVREAAALYPLIMTLEEAQLGSGLNAACAVVLAELAAPRARLLAAGVPDCIMHESHTHAAALAKFGLSVDQIVARLRGERVVAG